MNVLTIERITKSYTERKLFDQASFYLQEGEKVGIIGINGTGKSTLLKIMAGLEEPDEGSVIKANNIVTRYLSQNPVFDESHNVLESVISQSGQKEDNWNLEADAKSMLTKLGVTDFSQPTKFLSGGQRKRLALVAALLSDADILILDEPTNHLDNDMADWLEDYLKKWKKTLVMVTHDRYFLDSVANRMVELDQGQIYSYDTNYSGFLALKAEREEMDQASFRKRQSILRVELEWMQRGARARSTKQKARIMRYEDLKGQSGPAEEGKVELSSISKRLGKTTVELDKLTKSFGDKTLFQNFSYIFLNNDRVGFIGKNGCGKTTLMKIIGGKIEPDSGTVVIGQTVKIGYYTQEIATSKEDGISYMNPDEKVIDYIRNTAEYVQTKEGPVSASTMLERFLFPPSVQYSQLGKLSGGEKRRLHLLRILMEAPNVLILDEPTNDLDITTLTILEDYLDRFEGIVICVSHDRYFLDRTMRRIFAFEENGTIAQYEGGYTEYANRVEEKRLAELDAGNRTEDKSRGGSPESLADEKAKEGKVKDKKLKFTFQEKKDYETIEADIASLEQQIADLENEIIKNARDFVKLGEVTQKKEETEEKLEEKMMRWMYLEDLAAKIDEQ